MLVTRSQALQTVKLTLRFKRGTREVVVSNGVLEMLSEPARKVVMDESIDDNQRFKLLLEELHWAKEMSTVKMAEKLNIKHQMTLWRIMKRLNIRVRDKITASQLANTKYPKRDFDGGDVEKLKLWFLAHTDGSVQLDRQQVKVALGTPDPYLAFFFKELFGRHGHVGLAPYRNSYGQYEWWLWVYLPLRSFAWLLEKKVLALMDEGKLYDALGVAIDAEGSIIVRKLTRGRAARFTVTFYNEKEYIIAPLQQVLIRLGYDPRLVIVPKGMRTNYGALNNDCHHLIINGKANVKRLLEHVKLALYHKRLKAYLIKCALSDLAKPVYWEDIEPTYSKINAIRKKMLTESKSLASTLHVKWQKLKELLRSKRITKKQYEEERTRLEAEAWEALKGLKEKYDKRFGNLEELIKARFRARKPQNKSLTINVNLFEKQTNRNSSSTMTT